MCDIYCLCSYSHTENTQTPYSTPVRVQTNPIQAKRKQKRILRQAENQMFEAMMGFFGVVFLFMGLQPLKHYLATLTTNEWSRR